jgi:hypothetical protein
MGRRRGAAQAFPAILPASLTLVARHDGRKQAVAEAGGAILGAVALGVFAATAWLLASNTPPVVTIGVRRRVGVLTSSVGRFGAQDAPPFGGRWRQAPSFERTGRLRSFARWACGLLA